MADVTVDPAHFFTTSATPSLHRRFRGLSGGISDAAEGKDEVALARRLILQPRYTRMRTYPRIAATAIPAMAPVDRAYFDGVF